MMTHSRKLNSILNPTEKLKWADETSSVHFLSTHDIDMVRWYIGGAEAVEVYAAGIKGVLASKGFKTPDGAQAMVKFSNGVVSTFESAWILPKASPSGVESALELIGTAGILHLDRREEMLVYVNEQGFHTPKVSLGGQINGRLQGSIRWALEHFIDSIRNDTAPVIDAISGYKVVEIACAIHRSVDRGQPISLPLSD
jgi:predicted dehydrogenase